jgi:hypothetical protein
MLVSAVLIVIILGLIINIPFITRVVAFMRPLEVSADGASFCGRYRHWKLSHVTGRVLASKTVNTTYQGVRHDPNWATTSRYLSSSVHDTVRLQVAGGDQRDVQLLNYNVSVQSGDVITVWYANRGDKWATVAVLNYTTRQQNLNSADLFNILEPRGVVYLIPSIILTSFYLVFGGAIFFPVWAVLIGLYLWGQKRIRRSFAESDISALWELSNDEAKRLMA